MFTVDGSRRNIREKKKTERKKGRKGSRVVCLISSISDSFIVGRAEILTAASKHVTLPSGRLDRRLIV